MAEGTTRGKRRLGAFVKPIFVRSGLKIEDVVRKTHVSRQTVSRLMSGANLPRWPAVYAVLGAIGAEDAEVERALALWSIADVDTKTIVHAASLPDGYMRFRMDEREASRERTLDTVVIPGLLQIPEYAEEVAHGASTLIPGESWSQKAADERRDRQGLLDRVEPEPFRLHALIDEWAIRREICSPEGNRVQLDHLIEMGGHPNITVQVIPRSVRAYGALSGPIMILSFPEDDEPDSAYVESLTGLDVVENRESVARLSAVWDEVAARALSAEESAECIRKVRDTKEP